MTTTYSIAKDATGGLVLAREYLKGPTASEPGATVTGAVAGDHIKLCLAMSPKFPYLTSVDAVCIAAGSAEASMSIVGATGSSVPLKIIRSGKVAAVGDRITLQFDTPISIQTATAELHLLVNNSNGGDWFVQPNGFYSTTIQEA